ncbi:MAG: hypothetical protein HRU33_15490 [Rhodobacteraceae bacterium]|nr:hypothetical protein [Paracoccaceae bacterium]
MNAALGKFNEAYNKEIWSSQEAQDAFKNITPEIAINPNWLREAISGETYAACAQRASRIAPMPKLTAKYQAHVNRHQVVDTPNNG